MVARVLLVLEFNYTAKREYVSPFSRPVIGPLSRLGAAMFRRWRQFEHRSFERQANVAVELLAPLSLKSKHAAVPRQSRPERKVSPNGSGGLKGTLSKPCQ
jgi:hypothetical protein